MRAIVASVVAIGLFTLPAYAAGRKGSGNGANSASSSSSAAGPAAKVTPQPAAGPADDTAPSIPPATRAEAELQSEVQQLRATLVVEAQQIQDQQKRLTQLEERLSSSIADRNNPLAGPAAQPQPSVASLTLNPAAAAPSASTTIAANAAADTSSAGKDDPVGNDQPASWKFKGVTFTPGGYFAAETVWRQRAMSADVNTPFASAPLPGASQYKISEFNASGRQSRISMLVQGKLSTVKLGGFYEADFLSAGTTSNNNQSNSYTLRQRQFWAQAAFLSGWTITGGQMWSLVTQTAQGVDPRTEQLPMTIDAQYHVGFGWARQYGLRVAKDFNDKMWLAMSVEAPQSTFKAGGTATPFLFGQAGNGGGLLNTAQSSYSFNLTPDFVFKAAFQPGFGHYELFGVLSTFRDRIFPAGVSPYNDTRVGGGGGVNAWFPFDGNHVDLGFHFMMGNGVGRYGAAGLPDATVRPDGTLALIRSYQSLGTLEFHYPKFDIYLNTGGEYAGRTQFVSGASLIPNEGYGAIGFDNSGCWTEPVPGSGGFSPGSLSACSGNVRNVIEGTAGFWYNFYKGPMGQMKLGLQYSHEVLNTWSGVGSTGACTNAAHPSCGPSSNENMFFTSFRYYVP